jgi:hypothetical protein
MRHRRTASRALGLKALALVGALAVVAAGCGSSSSNVSGHLFDARTLASCLESHGAAVLQSDPAFVIGDHPGGAFQVGVGSAYADVAVAATDARAARTAKLARAMLKKRGSGGRARHRGNVAYWTQGRSNVPLDAVGRCLH